MLFYNPVMHVMCIHFNSSFKVSTPFVLHNVPNLPPPNFYVFEEKKLYIPITD